MTNNNVQEMIDEAVEEFRKKLEKEFAELMRKQFVKPKIIHVGL